MQLTNVWNTAHTLFSDARRIGQDTNQNLGTVSVLTDFETGIEPTFRTLLRIMITCKLLYQR